MSWVELAQQKAVSEWTYANHVQCMLVVHAGHYCGYAIFPKRPLQEEGYRGFATYVPVHGGITFAKQVDTGFCYGFDCAHADDDDNPLTRDLDGLKQETEKMAQAVALAADGYEQAYLSAETDKEKADVIDAYHERLRELEIADFQLTDNFGAMLKVIGGGL